MRPCRDVVVVPATLDNVPGALTVDLKIGGKVPAEVRHSDHNETATWMSRGIGWRDCREEDRNQKKSAEIAGQGPHEFVVA
jgi:protein-L-isoaspartate O-methyltransferase